MSPHAGQLRFVTRSGDLVAYVRDDLNTFNGRPMEGLDTGDLLLSSMGWSPVTGQLDLVFMPPGGLRYYRPASWRWLEALGEPV